MRFAIEESDFPVDQISGWEGIMQIEKIKELLTWKIALHNKWNDVIKSYVMMMFYYNKGIPDDPYFISPGRNGNTADYFPNFKPEHHARKDAFDFYTDVFFFKVFSAFDCIWQTLNVYLDCGLKSKKVTFGRVCRKIKNSYPDVELFIRKLFKDTRYRNGIILRDSIVHRLPTGAQGSGISHKGDATLFSISEYMTSDQTVEIAKDLLYFSMEANEKIKGQFVKNNSGN